MTIKENSKWLPRRWQWLKHKGMFILPYHSLNMKPFRIDFTGDTHSSIKLPGIIELSTSFNRRSNGGSVLNVAHENSVRLIASYGGDETYSLRPYVYAKATAQRLERHLICQLLKQIFKAKQIRRSITLT